MLSFFESPSHTQSSPRRVPFSHPPPSRPSPPPHSSRAIKSNQDLQPSAPLSNLVTNDFWGTPLTHSGSHKSYRPLCVLSFRLNYAVHGLEPFGYHLVNVGLHAVVSVLFTHFAGQLFNGRKRVTLVAGLLFATHPIHTEAVAGVVGRADCGAALFFLLSLMAYIKYCKCRDKPWPSVSPDGGGGGGGGLALPLPCLPALPLPLPAALSPRFYLYTSLALAAASMLTKEYGITVLAVCGFYHLLIHHKLLPLSLQSVQAIISEVGADPTN